MTTSDSLLQTRHREEPRATAGSASPFRTPRVAVPEKRASISIFVRIALGPTALTSVDHSMKLVPPT